LPRVEARSALAAALQGDCCARSTAVEVPTAATSAMRARVLEDLLSAAAMRRPPCAVARHRHPRHRRRGQASRADVRARREGRRARRVDPRLSTTSLASVTQKRLTSLVLTNGLSP
jgi:hypothetical protein